MMIVLIFLFSVNAFALDDLFMTVEEREILSKMREDMRFSKKESKAVSKDLYLNGFVHQPGGKSIVFINGKNIKKNKPLLSQLGIQEIKVKNTEALIIKNKQSRHMVAGQVWPYLDANIMEKYQYKKEE